LRLEELTYPEIDALDRQQTVFFLTFGNLEEHGPHIPIGSDYYQAIGVRDRLIERLRARYPEYAMVVIPVIPLGEGGANDLARQFDHVGTFAMRYSTLRDVAIDMGAAVASKGFENILLLHSHGTPLHNVAFNEAAAFVSDRYGVRMVNITSLVFGEGFYSDAVIERHLGIGWQEEIGITGHAGTAETSANLFLHDLVKPLYRDLEPFVVEDLPGAFAIHERTGWQGYWSDPSRATAAIGEELIDDFVDRSFRIAELALAGEDLSNLPLYPDDLPPLPAADVFVGEVLGLYTERQAEIDEWLRRREGSR
jgi:creatinine amidohydrolase/Fe(II)-dependent formamide hydrolase-like protein